MAREYMCQQGNCMNMGQAGKMITVTYNRMPERYCSWRCVMIAAERKATRGDNPYPERNDNHL